MVVTFLVLLIFSYNVVFLFVGTASLGLFLSSTFPSMLAYTEDSLQYKGEGRARARRRALAGRCRFALRPLCALLGQHHLPARTLP